MPVSDEETRTSYPVTLSTSKGEITLELYTSAARLAVVWGEPFRVGVSDKLVTIANGTAVVEPVAIEGGNYSRGSVIVATENGQIIRDAIIILKQTLPAADPELTSRYEATTYGLLGRVTGGEEVLDQLTPGDVLLGPLVKDAAALPLPESDSGQAAPRYLLTLTTPSGPLTFSLYPSAIPGFIIKLRHHYPELLGARLFFPPQGYTANIIASTSVPLIIRGQHLRPLHRGSLLHRRGYPPMESDLLSLALSLNEQDGLNSNVTNLGEIVSGLGVIDALGSGERIIGVAFHEQAANQSFTPPPEPKPYFRVRDRTPTHQLTITTTKGVLKAVLYGKAMPEAVAGFIGIHRHYLNGKVISAGSVVDFWTGIYEDSFIGLESNQIAPEVGSLLFPVANWQSLNLTRLSILKAPQLSANYYQVVGQLIEGFEVLNQLVTGGEILGVRDQVSGEVRDIADPSIRSFAEESVVRAEAEQNSDAILEMLMTLSSQAVTAPADHILDLRIEELDV